MMALIERGELTPTAAREIISAQVMMSTAIRDAAGNLYRGDGSSPSGQDSDD
jgi:hypothetical protein